MEYRNLFLKQIKKAKGKISDLQQKIMDLKV